MVKQEDREAYVKLCLPPECHDAKLILNGQWDTHVGVQAFAAHRAALEKELEETKKDLYSYMRIANIEVNENAILHNKIAAMQIEVDTLKSIMNGILIGLSYENK